MGAGLVGHEVGVPAARDKGGEDVGGNLRSVTGGERYVPDYTLSFDVTPRNLNLFR